MSIDFRKFTEENKKNIYLKDIPDHSINLETKKQIIDNVNSFTGLLDYKIADDDVFLKNIENAINKCVSSFNEMMLKLINEIKYVSFEEYKELLIKITSNVIKFIKNEKNADKKVFIVFPAEIDTDDTNIINKSNFWTFMLIYHLFDAAEVKYNIILSDEVKYDENNIYIYPDDTIYSGTQFVNAFSMIDENKKIICKFMNKDENKSIIIPLVAYIGENIINKLREACHIMELKDLANTNIKLSGDTTIIPSMSKLIEYKFFTDYKFILENTLFSKFESEIYTKEKYIKEYGCNLSENEEEYKLRMENIIKNIEKIRENYTVDFIKNINLPDNQLKEEVINIIDTYKYNDKDIQLYFFNMEIMYYCDESEHGKIKHDRINLKLFNSINNNCMKYEYYKKLKNQSSMLDDIKTLTKLKLKINPYQVNLYFQHKLADFQSVPNILYSNIPSLKYENGKLQLIELKHLFNNCVKDDEKCPPAYYKKINYTYDNEKIYKPNLKFKSFRF